MQRTEDGNLPRKRHRAWSQPLPGFTLRTFLIIGCETSAQPLRPSGSSSILRAQPSGLRGLIHYVGFIAGVLTPLVVELRQEPRPPNS